MKFDLLINLSVWKHLNNLVIEYLNGCGINKDHKEVDWIT